LAAAIVGLIAYGVYLWYKCWKDQRKDNRTRQASGNSSGTNSGNAEGNTANNTVSHTTADFDRDDGTREEIELETMGENGRRVETASETV
jgi:hypothetical protein